MTMHEYGITIRGEFVATNDSDKPSLNDVGGASSN